MLEGTEPLRLHPDIEAAWPVYFLITERIVSFTEVKHELSIMDIERIFHTEMAKRAQKIRHEKNRGGQQ